MLLMLLSVLGVAAAVAAARPVACLRRLLASRGVHPYLRMLALKRKDCALEVVAFAHRSRQAQTAVHGRTEHASMVVAD